MKRLKNDITYFLKLYRLSRAAGMDVQQVVDTLAIANNDLSAIEEKFNRLREDVDILQSQKHTCKRNLCQLTNQIATTSRLLNSLHISCETERREIKNLFNEKARFYVILHYIKYECLFIFHSYLMLSMLLNINPRIVIGQSKKRTGKFVMISCSSLFH